MIKGEESTPRDHPYLHGTYRDIGSVLSRDFGIIHTYTEPTALSEEGVRTGWGSSIPTRNLPHIFSFDSCLGWDHPYLHGTYCLTCEDAGEESDSVTLYETGA